jgi:2'-5' RNA ligase
MSAEAEIGPRPASRRVFFALWPDPGVRSQLLRATREPVRLSGGRPTSKDRLHLTIAFLGSLTQAGVDIACKVPPISVGAFDLALDRLGSFENGGVLWIGPEAVPPALVTLEQQLWDALEQSGFIRDERPYQPHLTLARRGRRAVELPVTPVLWRVTELALVESLPDGRNVHYEVLQTWPL